MAMIVGTECSNPKFHYIIKKIKEIFKDHIVNSYVKTLEFQDFKSI
jgi:hypothetical protein